ncbi:hypothetical protein AOC05_03790 [Arthrobacter alpinus]|uniref:Uncharacterized protein n=1 Tax=Arthrobacter alpinus TaxID=656366 RepID=A0A0M4QLD8_9MICC|nr:arylsulfotransferase family protein [Arthrobacter alpinus]ALE91660.1 hypothetical protein AOC05_03790 [Arthrobacter alpinus]
MGITDLRVQEFEGKPVLIYWAGTGIGGHGEGSGTIWGTSYKEVPQVNTGNGLKSDLHGFRCTDAGTVLMISYPTIHSARLERVGGTPAGYLFACHVQEVVVRTGSPSAEGSSAAKALTVTM